MGAGLARKAVGEEFSGAGVAPVGSSVLGEHAFSLALVGASRFFLEEGPIDIAAGVARAVFEDFEADDVRHGHEVQLHHGREQLKALMGYPRVALYEAIPFSDPRADRDDPASWRLRFGVGLTLGPTCPKAVNLEKQGVEGALAMLGDLLELLNCHPGGAVENPPHPVLRDADLVRDPPLVAPAPISIERVEPPRGLGVKISQVGGNVQPNHYTSQITPHGKYTFLLLITVLH